jgi:MFS family permease
VYFRLKLKDSEEFCHLSEARSIARNKPPEARSAEEQRLLESPFRELVKPENRKKIIVVIIMASSAIVGYWAVLGWIPAWVNQLTGTQAIAERSMTAIALNLGLVVFAVLGGPLVSKLGRETYFRVGVIGSFLCCMGMFLGIKSFGPMLLCCAFFTGGFTVMPFVLLFIYVPELFDTRVRGTAFGFSYNVGRLVAGGAALYAGQLIGYFNGSYALAAAVLSCVYLIGAIASCFMTKSDGKVSAYEWSYQHVPYRSGPVGVGAE